MQRIPLFGVYISTSLSLCLPLPCSCRVFTFLFQQATVIKKPKEPCRPREIKDSQIKIREINNLALHNNCWNINNTKDMKGSHKDFLFGQSVLWIFNLFVFSSYTCPVLFFLPFLLEVSTRMV